MNNNFSFFRSAREPIVSSLRAVSQKARQGQNKEADRFRCPTTLTRKMDDGFTLVELLVVIAIIGVLAALALPAYNNYATKSRFTEVVVATNPTKTAIAACAGTGDCISNGAISLGSSAASAALTLGYSSTINAADTSLAVIYATAYADVISNGSSPAQAASTAQSYVQQQQQAAPGYYAVSAATGDGSGVCLVLANGFTSTSGNACSGQASLALVNQYMTAANNPYYSTAPLSGGGAATANIPCVGGLGCSPGTKYAASVSYASNGTITATATSNAGLHAETFVLIPSYSTVGRVDWMASGSCKTRAGGALC